MINPDRTTKSPRDLCYEVRLKENLWGAWNAVRRRALLSRDKETSIDAREFDQNPSKHIRALHEALRHGTFQFAPQRAVLRIKKGKTPRPIVVSPVRNRIVQRAILDVLQSGAPRISKRLGAIPATLATPTSVGGIPGRGSPDAVALIRDQIAAGATHFIRSDIKNFFTRVPAPKVLAFLQEQSGDQPFVEFVKAALAVELSNAEEPKIRDWISLFPTEEVGVPQGSSLSALCANVVLRDFDKALNERGICTVRYIDDFVMLGRSEKSLKLAWASAERVLGEMGLEAHSPFPGSAKAANGTVQAGFDFLSFKFAGNSVAPSRKAKQGLIAAVRQEVVDVRKAIQAAGQEPRRAEPRLVQVLNKIDRRVRGWGDAFKDVDQRLEFAQMDEEIRNHVDKLIKWYFNSSKGIQTTAMMRTLGVALLSDTPLNQAVG